jgi:4-amino-4-deoxy-L-arabinose transferase-like glycosyltransferase
LRESPDKAWAALLIFAVALGIRLTWIGMSSHQISSDELDYHRLAASLIQHGAYAIDGVPTAYRPPGYPFVLWAVYSLGGVTPAAAQVFQAVLDAFLAVLLYLTLYKRDVVAAYIAGLCWALFPTAALYSGLLLSETVFTVLTSVAILLLARRSSGAIVLSGLFLGFACLIKPSLIIFCILAGIYVIGRWSSKKKVLLGLLVAGLTLVPWMLRNHATFGVFTVSANTGMNLYVGNNPGATGGYRGEFPPEIVAAMGNEQKLNSVSTQLALDYVVGNPVQFVVNGAKKMARLFASEGELLVYALSPSGLSSRYAEKYRNLPIAAVLIVNLPSFFILLVGIWGLIVAESSTHRDYTLLLFASILVTTFIFFGSSRFRYPIMPFLVMYGSLFLAQARSILPSLWTGKKTALAVTFLMIAGIWTAEAIMIANA